MSNLTAKSTKSSAKNRSDRVEHPRPSRRCRRVRPDDPGANLGRALVALALLLCTPGACIPLTGEEDATSQNIDTDPSATIEFSRDIRPILNRHCVGCHGGVKQAAGLSFVYRDQVMNPLKSGLTPVVPGDIEASELIHRITTDDPDERMPPPEEHPAGLDADAVGALTDWVKQGAPWSDHWAFVKPEPGPLPAVRNVGWARTPLDRFVLARLEREGIEPAPEAHPDRWLRRVTLDLTGLPPTPEERRQFREEDAESGRDTACAAVVDRLLDSPRFGERWASVWLDLVRYADSKGLGADGRRNIWKYRDWVISAFNDDMPYDEFTVQQIAGDLIPDASTSTRLATAVHRLTQTNQEGGTDDEEFRVGAVLDRVNTVWQTWQGITFGCVQCHSHPYDPIRHDEYYNFAAFFNNTADSDLDEDWPVLETPIDTAAYREADRLDNQIADLKRSIWKTGYDLVADEGAWKPLRIEAATSNKATRISVETRENHDEFRTVDTVVRNTDITLETELPDAVKSITAIRLTAKPLDPDTALSDSEWGFVLSHIEAALIGAGDADSFEPIPLTIADVAGDEPDPFFDPRESLNPKSNRGFSAYSRIHHPRQAAFVLENPVDVPPGARLRVQIKHRVMLLGAFSLVTRRGHLAVSDDRRFTEWLSDPDLRLRRDRLANLVEARNSIRGTAIPVLEERPPHLARPTHVFVRGLFLDKADRVSPGTPASLPPIETGRDAPVSRLELARWLVDADNPLTARVAVNRFWARLFGTGLVATEEDFGSSGESPSHPALLDFLALKFQNEHAWSVKGLLREIVLSSTYRQDSALRPDLMDRDQNNRLLARGPRVRLPAETVRDQALAVSGLLGDTMFGPPVHPPLPEGVWRPFSSGDKWSTPDKGKEDRYRRSIYTYTKRSIPYPMFAAFDAPSREFCAPRRLRSNTPLQALTTLNGDTFTECSEALGRRMAAAGDSIDAGIRHGFILAVCREPSDGEIATLGALYDRLTSGPNAMAHRDALGVTANVLLNLDEILMK